MCFQTRNPEILVADKPITCYKVIKRDGAPEFLRDRWSRRSDPALVTKYEPNTLYEDNGATLFPHKNGPYDQLFNVHRGFHSFAEASGLDYRLAGDSLHAKREVEFAIPVGARYMIGKHDSGRTVYISDKIESGSLSALNS